VSSLLERYDGLRLVWRHFPDAELHPGADLAAELSELAASHGLFWQAHDLLLAGRGEFTRDGLESVAAELGLDAVEAAAALDERRYREVVREQVVGGERSGVRGTPTFFLDERPVRGHWRELARLVPKMLDGA
jgi:protein-disulfide isomerase